MKLEVGMYVRLGRNQGIRKIEDYDEDIKRYYLDDDICDAWGDPICTIEDENDIIGEPSFNIIDLIEVGDYVNGYRVVERIGNWLDLGSTTAENKDIKSIVTKEMYSNAEYKVETN